MVLHAYSILSQRKSVEPKIYENYERTQMNKVTRDE